MRRAGWALGVVLAVALAVGADGRAVATTPRLAVVAAEDFWGSIAGEVGGERVEVTSLISGPNVHAHDYEPKPSDGVAVARASVAVVNGAGYDGWMSDLLAANPAPERQVVDVGVVVGAKEGDNPHLWYSPQSVEAVVDALADALTRADPAGAGYFQTRRDRYRTETLQRYNDLRARIRAEHGGVPIGASESIVAPLAEDLGLPLVTPASFLAAIAEGQEPTARDKVTVDQQIAERRIAVFVYNAQNSTPDVEALVDRAETAGIPVVAVTETPSPEGTPFHDWQADQLQRLEAALAESAGGPSSVAVDGGVAPADPAVPGDGPPRWIVGLAAAVLVLGGVGAAASTLRRSGAPVPDA